MVPQFKLKSVFYIIDNKQRFWQTVNAHYHQLKKFINKEAVYISPLLYQNVLCQNYQKHFIEEKQSYLLATSAHLLYVIRLSLIRYQSYQSLELWYQVFRANTK